MKLIIVFLLALIGILIVRILGHHQSDHLISFNKRGSSLAIAVAHATKIQVPQLRHLCQYIMLEAGQILDRITVHCQRGQILQAF